MKIALRYPVFFYMLIICNLQLNSQNLYSNYSSMSQNIYKLEKEYPSVCTVNSLTKTAGGKEILEITIGTGDKNNKPGIAVVGGVEGNYLLGVEIASGFAAALLKESDSPDIKSLLDKVTFYILPNVSPDATEQFFSKLKYERNVNCRSTDDDRDFVSDEDPFEDLNNDGYITLIRVTDPTGSFVESNEDARILVPADLSKGEKGKYLVFSEGIDNDKDGKYNEDGEGGVNFNRNFTFNYESFGLNSGLYPVSEPETKAVADFLFDRFNIYTVFSFGPQDNLGQPLKSAEGPASQPRPQTRRGQYRRPAMSEAEGIITSILKSDETINKMVSDRYHEITGAKGAPVSRTTRGNFMDWAYFHYGRYSFSTPAWWITAEKGKSPEAAFLKYADSKKMNDVFVPWAEIKDPDFADKKTEVGGIKPFVMNTPPADTLGDIVKNNYKFITAIASMHPELEFLDMKTENAGENLFRITLHVHNKGIFATCAEIGDDNMFTRIMRISLELQQGQSIISGLKVERIKRLEGGQSAEFSWLILGKGTVKVTAGAVNAGIISDNISLR